MSAFKFSFVKKGGFYFRDIFCTTDNGFDKMTGWLHEDVSAIIFGTTHDKYVCKIASIKCYRNDCNVYGLLNSIMQGQVSSAKSVHLFHKCIIMHRSQFLTFKGSKVAKV